MAERSFAFKMDGIDILERFVVKTKITENDVFNFDIKAQSNADLTKRLVVMYVAVSVKRLNNPDTLARMLVGFGFLVENIQEAFDKTDDGKYTIPVDFENILKMISISTMRGIMFSEFRGTHLHNAILPVTTIDSFTPVPGNIFDTQVSD
jgi:hypothetical protein